MIIIDIEKLRNEKIVLINGKEWIDMPRGQFTKDGLTYRVAKLKNFSNRCVYMFNSKGTAIKICNGFDSIASIQRKFEKLYTETEMTPAKVLAFIEK